MALSSNFPKSLFFIATIFIDRPRIRVTKQTLDLEIIRLW